MEQARPPAWAWQHKLGQPRQQAAGSAAAVQAVMDLRQITAEALAERDDVTIAGTAPGMLTVRLGGAEVALLVQPTGVLEKTCAGCEKPFWYSEGGVAGARFCSTACRERERSQSRAPRPSTPETRAAKAQGMRQARIRAGAGVRASIVSRALRSAGPVPDGLRVQASGFGVTVLVPGNDDLPRFARILDEADYVTKEMAGILYVTGRKGGG
jgi:hypothetical protein